MAASPDSEQDLADLESGRTPPDGLYAAIHALGDGPSSGRAKSIVEPFLRHSDAQLRYIALNVLTIHWGCTEHRSTCESFARSDPDADNRRMGISGLGTLLEGSRDREALAFLLPIFRDDAEELHIRDAAYSAILYILGAPVADQPRLTRLIDMTSDVNWNRIAEAERISHG